MSDRKSLFTKSGSKPPSSSENISGYFGKEVIFEGKMSFEGIFRLDGKFEGEIFESGTLIVGETANVKGKIDINTIIINGQVEGEIHAHGRVEIHSTGKLNGNLITPILTIEEGGLLDGQCKMRSNIDKERDLQLPQIDHPLSA